MSGLLLLLWLGYKYLISSRDAGPIVLLNNKIVKCINNEDYFNISSNRIYREGNSETAKTCKLVLKVNPSLHELKFLILVLSREALIEVIIFPAFVL